ncbi:MAG: GAF domain-containing sensor histidine kinase [Blastochloris sp.]|nr:GAF domain-containing sensor histidine kinase [Blastochloris sp.]
MYRNLPVGDMTVNDTPEGARFTPFERMFSEQNAQNTYSNEALLYQLGRSLHRSIDLDDVLQRTLESALLITSAQVACVVLLDRQAMATHWVCSDVHMHLDTAHVAMSLEAAWYREAIRLQRVLAISDSHEYTEAAVQRLLLPGRSLLVVPLLSQAAPRAVLTLAHPEPAQFAQHHLAMMSESAETMAIAIHHAQRYAQLQDIVDSFEEGKFKLAHDIRSPLSAASASLEIIKYSLKPYTLDPAADSEIQNALQSGQRSLHSVIQLVGDLLDSKRLQIGQQSIAYEELSLELLFTEVVTILQPLANQLHIVLHNHVQPRALVLPGDNHLIRRLLINLISNALRYTPEGGQIALKASEEPDTSTLLLCVEDTGTGVAVHDRERIFQPFVQGRGNNNNDNPRGAGLGLAICREIVQGHQGTIWVEDREGGGSRFCVRLPTDVEIPDDDDDLHADEIDPLF